VVKTFGLVLTVVLVVPLAVLCRATARIFDGMLITGS
jgi:hypothetical protein